MTFCRKVFDRRKGKQQQKQQQKEEEPWQEQTTKKSNCNDINPSGLESNFIHIERIEIGVPLGPIGGPASEPPSP